MEIQRNEVRLAPKLEKQTPVYRIEPDGIYWAIARHRPSRNDPGRFDRVSWYQTLDQACEALLHRLTAENARGPYGLPELLKAIDLAVADIADILDRLRESAKNLRTVEAAQGIREIGGDGGRP